MALTLVSAPTAQIAAWRPMVHKVSSDRYANDAFSITSVSSGTGAKARYACVGHTLAVGDVVTGSAFTGASVAYNVKQTVTVINASWFETDQAFVASGTGAGTITRTNNNFEVRGDIYVFDGENQSYTSIAQNGALIRIYYGAAHGYSIGDYIFLPDTSQHYGWYKIVNTPSSSAAEVVATFVATETGYTKKATFLGSKRMSAIIESGSYRFKFEVGGYLKSVLTTQFYTGNPSTIQTPNNDCLKYYGVLFTEEFDDADGVLTEGDNKFSLALPSLRASWQHDESQNMTAYFTGSSSSKFLTRAPKTKSIRPGEEEQLSILVPSGVSAVKAAYQAYDATGATLSVNYLSTATVELNRIVVPINSTMFNSSTIKFDVWIVNGSNTQISEKRTFIVDNKQYQNAKRFHFENSLGGVDSYTFTGDYIEDVDVQRTEFKKQVELGWATTDRGMTTLGTFRADAKTVFSEFLNKADATWLIELLESPWIVYRDLNQSSFTPVVQAAGQYTPYNSAQLTQLKFTYSLSNSFKGLHN